MQARSDGRPSVHQREQLADLPLPKIERAQGLSVTVYESLRKAISDGTLPPDYHLREHPLAGHFGVSTTPVREALRRLEREGLVVIRPNRGAVVRAFDLRGATNLYEVREVLEVEAVRQAALAPERDLSKAVRLLAELTELHEQDAGTRGRATGQRVPTPQPRQGQDRAQEFVRGAEQGRTDGPLWPADIAFHRALHEIGPNHLLADLAERTHRQIQAIRARTGTVTTGKPGQSNAEHVVLLEAVRRRKPDEAERIVRQHIRSVRDRVLPGLERAAAG